MIVRITSAFMIVLFFTHSLAVYSQSAEDESIPDQNPEGSAQSSAPTGGEPEEIEVTGEQNLPALRTRMWDAEENAYQIFNKFNDEERFNISCNMHQPTGSLIERQVCQPEFVRQATREHARDYFENIRSLYDPYNLDYSPTIAHQPMEMEIASQQREYRNKLREIANEHPEFLNAIIRYSELRSRYESESEPEE